MMAKVLWAKVFYQVLDPVRGAVDLYAGILQQEPGWRYLFTYDADYLRHPLAKPISYSMPLRVAPYVSEFGLPPFFDNLVAEGWLRNAQARALGVHPDNHLALLLGFGHDLAGAVSVIDPTEESSALLNNFDDVTRSALASRASLSGIQRKILVTKAGKEYRPVGPKEVSSFIAKLSSDRLGNMIELEYLSTQVVRKLLSDDQIVDMEISFINAIGETALVIPRFDRLPSGIKLHFEEFSQLLGKRAGDDKYEGSYEEMLEFVKTNPLCMSAERLKLLRRIFACLLLGNTDAHFKNFAMFHRQEGLRLTPSYDLVSSACYPDYQTIALSIGQARNLSIGQLKAKHLLALAKAADLDDKTIFQVVEEFRRRIPMVQTMLEKSDVGSLVLRNNLIERMEKRWKGSFDSIGQLLSKKREDGVRRKD